MRHLSTSTPRVALPEPRLLDPPLLTVLLLVLPLLLLPLLLLVLSFAPAAAQIPCANGNSTVNFPSGHLWVSPAGSGPDFGQAGVALVCTVRDCNNQPIANLPAQDLWLDSWSGTDPFLPCPNGGTIADAPTNANGTTSWLQPMRAGGAVYGGLNVYIQGVPLAGPAIPITVRSPDMNADGLVDIVDVSHFSQVYFGAYAPEADFNADGVLDLTDIGILARTLGDSC